MSPALRRLARGAATALALASLWACNPSVPHPATGDAGADAQPPPPPPADAGPDAPPPPPPPGSPVEILSGAGTASVGTLTLDVQIGTPAAGSAADGTRTLTTAPALR